jgi:hypothetical protein
MPFLPMLNGRVVEDALLVAVVMQDYLGRVFLHALLGVILAAFVGSIGGCLGGFLRRSEVQVVARL